MAQRKRPRAFNRLPAWDGDDGDDLTQVFPWITTHPWNGTTAPHEPAEVWYSAPPRDSWTFTGRQSRTIMTVNPDGGQPTPEALRVTGYLRDQVDILRSRGQLDRISEENLHRREIGMLSSRHTASEIVAEASLLLRMPS